MLALVLFFAWKRWWPSLVTLIVAVPGGMLLNEWVKILVHRQRAFVDGSFVDWSGRLVSVFSAVSLIAVVGFSRIALGAHFLIDVLAAIFFGIIWLTFCLFATKPMRRGMVSTAGVPLISEPAMVGMELAEKPVQSLPS